MTSLDDTILPPELKLFKILLPFLPADAQKVLAVFLKWTELVGTVRYYEQNPPRQQNPDTESLLKCLKDILPPGELSQMEQFMDIFENMDQYREMFESFSAFDMPGQKEGDL
ncbi:MAG: hypothetical protein LUE92_14700 [Clostridiales bacterium]|nr:hypothetical protein [Lachnospiraceae bacterium]MCD8150777.1 hypothetical protein [Clostridiales bacterium]